jgi:hypothetical protein
MPTKPSHQLTLHDRLNCLALLQAKKLAGRKRRREAVESGTRGGRPRDPRALHHRPVSGGLSISQVVVTIACSHEGELGDYHPAAVISLILEEKLALGLAAPPDANTPWEQLAEHELETRALAEREERARKESMRIKPADRATPLDRLRRRQRH